MSARILVVDDSASMRQMVSFALTSAGFAVEEAEDGAVALGRAKGQRFQRGGHRRQHAEHGRHRADPRTAPAAGLQVHPLLMLTTESAADKKSEGAPLVPPAGWSSRSIPNSWSPPCRKCWADRPAPLPSSLPDRHCHEHGPATLPRHLLRGEPRRPRRDGGWPAGPGIGAAGRGDHQFVPRRPFDQGRRRHLRLRCHRRPDPRAGNAAR